VCLARTTHWRVRKRLWGSGGPEIDYDDFGGRACVMACMAPHEGWEARPWLRRPREHEFGPHARRRAPIDAAVMAPP
jgi:hypothetical protein